jgi:hypothetical protein
MQSGKEKGDICLSDDDGLEIEDNIPLKTAGNNKRLHRDDLSSALESTETKRQKLD